MIQQKLLRVALATTLSIALLFIGGCGSDDDPTVPPQGIENVWIHGVPVLEAGALRVPETFPGRILRRV